MSLFSWFCKFSIAPLVKFLFVKEIKGRKNIPKRNFILVSNHQSYLDVLIDGSLCVPRNFHFIGRIDSWKGISKIFVKGLYFIASVIPLNRNDKESKNKVIQKAIEVLKKGDVLIIYPEGTRTKTGKLQEGKYGVAKIFLKTGVPILPVGIKGTFELLPPHKKLKVKKIVTVNIGKPIFFKKELEKIKKINKHSKEYSQILAKITDEVMASIASLISEE